ncbi:MAG: FAD:protein FMN transferase [Gammaproteobacteria bacterium]|nr:FAD:protein FMN transferase [Gammaproteobacteria bacterium]MCW8909219.1 FAD:protein FMN transferase [Gammaproteobacteria bacterium]MCW9004152.1 FAD:protein FMN transferase [Gammaproteobacteria bacterium]MCW9056614.1 FAD:protein FMN transferase [Gammaproteobacteria bacterium]
MKALSGLIFSGLLALLSGCEPSPDEFQHTILNFGTLITVTLYDVDEETAIRAFNDLDNDFAYFHSTWSPWEAGSLSRINSLIPTQKAFSVGPSVLPLINESLHLAITTDHLFNPAIGKLINLWQFHKSDDPDIRPPDADKIRALVKSNPKLTDLTINGIRMLSKNPDIQLNFGAFAKGYAIDLSIQHLKNLGIKNAIINTGGDLKAIGKHGDRHWRIAIQHPRQQDIIATIETRGEESIFTSGDYERYYMYKGKRYHHILDPRTGYPADQSQSVTVIHNNSGFADAAATALFIAGPEKWWELAKKLGLTQVMLIDKQGNIHLTPKMKNRLLLKNPQETTLIVSPAL